MKNVLKAFARAVVILALVILVRYLISGRFSISWDDLVVLVIVIVVTAFATYIERKKRI